MELRLIENIKKIILDLYGIEWIDIKLEVPPKKELWDYAFGAFLLSRDLKKNPAMIAQELVSHFETMDMVDSASSEWPYVNIKMSQDNYTQLFKNLYLSKQNLTWIQVENNKTIVIDYIGTNVWKPLHIGHMCTPNQWQVLVNVYRKLWYKVIGDSHIWDWGIIFGKLIYAYKLWWDEQKLKENAVDYLLELYVKATSESEKHSHLDEEYRNEFKLLSEGNSESIELWKIFTRYSIDAMQVQLDRLHVQSDYNIWESFYEWLDLPKMEDFPDLTYDMHSIVKELIEKWIAIQNDDNSVWVEFDESLKIPSCILQKRDGTHGYLASDLAAIKYRMQNWNPEKIVYFIDSRQKLHLQQAFLIAKKAWWLDDTTELFHASNGFISLKDGAMSTRKGRIIKLDDLLDEAEERARKIIVDKRDDIVWVELDELSKIIGIWAIKYWYLKKSRETDVVFDWDEFMTFDGNSWPYIQYAYVRSLRILEKVNMNFDLDFEYNFSTTEEKELIKKLNWYKDTIDKTAQLNMPHHLSAYAYELTKTFNSFYNAVHILNEESDDVKVARLQLVALFWVVIRDTFWLLWIDMPEKM